MEKSQLLVKCKKKELRNYTNRKVDEKRWFFDDDEEDKEKKNTMKNQF